MFRGLGSKDCGGLGLRGLGFRGLRFSVQGFGVKFGAGGCFLLLTFCRSRYICEVSDPCLDLV